MNRSIIMYLLGWVLNLQAAFLLLPVIVAAIYRESAGLSYLAVAILSLTAGLCCTWKKPKNTVFYAREGFVTVALSWITLSFVGAMPFVLSGDIPNVTDALFETISGFTTTGASILADVQSLSRCSLMWRSFTHWIGGMGVLVFMLAILPLAGGHNIYLMRAESPGPSVGKLAPRLRSTAVILYTIYFVMTLVQIVLLLGGEMPLFDAVATSFATAGTGGFSIYPDSIASCSPYIQTVTAVFMVLFGINFNVYYLLLIRKGEQALRYEEMRWYLGIIAISVLLIALDVRSLFGSMAEALHHAFFQVSSIITTTGFASVDFNIWRPFPKVILIALMFIGACAGSTGGGIKVSRISLMIKTALREVDYLLHPRNVRVLKLEGKRVSDAMIRSVHVFLMTYFLVFSFSVLLISMNELDLVTTFTSVAATLNNIGPGLEAVGPMGNFGGFSTFSKYVLMFDMLAGRLELFPMLILFAPKTWKK